MNQPLIRPALGSGLLPQKKTSGEGLKLVEVEEKELEDEFDDGLPDEELPVYEVWPLLRVAHFIDRREFRVGHFHESLANLVQLRIPWERDNAWNTIGLNKPGGFDYTRFELNLEKRRKWTFNLWGRSDHEGPRGNKNENNDGFGLGFYFNDNTFASFDQLRNTVRGQTRIVSVGREWELVKFWGYQVLFFGTISRVDYEVPRKGSIRVIAPIPGLSIANGSLSMNCVFLQDGNGSKVALAFLSYRF